MSIYIYIYYIYIYMYILYVYVYIYIYIYIYTSIHILGGSSRRHAVGVQGGPGALHGHRHLRATTCCYYYDYYYDYDFFLSFFEARLAYNLSGYGVTLLSGSIAASSGMARRL